MSFLSKIYRNAKKSDSSRARRSVLRLETLENREMLSVSTFDYQEIRLNYPEANLPESKYDVEIQEIGGANVSLANLKSALQSAASTTKDDLILIDASTVQSLKFAQASDAIEIDLDSASQGSVTVVVQGDQALTIDAADLARVLKVGPNAAVTFANFVFKNGLADDGGQASGELLDYEFGAGGAVYNSGVLTLLDVSISASDATYGVQSNGVGFFSAGGAIYNAGTATIVGGTFSNNVAKSGTTGFGNVAMYGAGGAIFNNVGAKLTVFDSVFESNVAENKTVTQTVTTTDEEGNETTETVQVQCNGAGGAIYNYGGTLKLYGVALASNNAAFGGGVFNANAPTATGVLETDRVSFVQNTARYDGAGLFNSYGRTTATNSLFAENVATGNGGGIYVDGKVENGAIAAGRVTLQNVTIAKNSGASGGGVYVENGGAYCYNSIIVGATKGGDAAKGSGHILGANTLTTFTSWSGNSAGNLVYDSTKPLFANLSSGDYRLAADSQALDQGAYYDYVASASRDLNGDVRVVGETQDLGAYEYYETKPTAALATTTYVVKENESFLLSATSTNADAKFYWDLTGSLEQNDSNFMRGPQEFYTTPKQQGFAPGVYEIRMKTMLGDVESIVQTAILKVEPSPLISVVSDVVEIAQGAGILRLNLDLISGAAPSNWIIDWGDGTKTTINELSTGIDVAHFYQSPSSAKNYAVKATVVDALGNGENVVYTVANFAAAPAASSASLLETKRDDVFAELVDSASDADDEFFFVVDSDDDDFFVAFEF